MSRHLTPTANFRTSMLIAARNMKNWKAWGPRLFQPELEVQHRLMDRSTPTIAKSAETQSAALPSQPELTQYRAISFWAVATLLAGLAAPLALVGPLLWWVPLVTIPLAILAFRQLRQPDPRYVGKTAAVFGICLAALFLPWGVAQRLSRETYLSAEARRFSDEYLQLLLTGQTREAHQIQS